jgi:sugar lactone lactonase YvrE
VYCPNRAAAGWCICLDGENAVWYADVPNNRCVRVRESGELMQSINLDRSCFACMLGGTNRRKLLLMATEWRGSAAVTDGRRTGQVLTIKGPVPGVGRPEEASTNRPCRGTSGIRS